MNVSIYEKQEDIIMKYELTDLLLCAFPIALIVAMLIHVDVAKGIGIKVGKKSKNNFIKDYWSLEQAKAVQGVAAAFIILHHLTQAVTKYGTVDRGPVTILQSLGIYFVSIFFFFSGYGLLLSYRSKENYMDGFLLKRLPVVLVPFMVTNAIYAATIGLDSERIKTIPDMFSSILGFTLINTNAWYVVEILLLYIVFYLAYHPRKKKKVQVAEDGAVSEEIQIKVANEKLAFAVVTIFTVLMIIGSLLLCHDNTELNGHWFKGEWWYNTTILFVVGMAFAAGGEKLRERLQKFYWLLLVICAAIFGALFVIEEKVTVTVGYYQEWEFHSGYYEKAITLIAQSVACISFVVFLLLIMMKCRFKNKALTFLGSVSFEVYLIHDIFAKYLGGDYLSDKTDPSLLLPIVLYALVLVLSYGAAVLLHMIDGKVIEFWKAYRKVENYAALTFEARAKLDRRRFVLHIVYVIYAGVLLGFIGCSAYGFYQTTIAPYQEFQRKKSSVAKAAVGDEVIFGNFELDMSEDMEGYEEIPWVVLEKNGNKRLLVAKYAMYSSGYNPQRSNNRWDLSSVRKLLNNDFYFSAFSEDERKMILQEETYGDKVFLLNEAQVRGYFPTDEDRQLEPSKAAKMLGVNVNIFNDKSWWWLSDQAGDQKVKVVTPTGEFGEEYVNYGTGAVRPCVWVDVK